MAEYFVRVVNVKQMENENLLYYVKSSKQIRYVATNQLGKSFLYKFVEMQSEYRDLTDPQDQQDMKDNSIEHWIA